MHDGKKRAPGVSGSNECVKTAQGKLAVRDGGVGKAAGEEKNNNNKR